MPGTSVDTALHQSYELLQCIGRGGFGEVYLARMRTSGGLQTQVVVKLLRADLDPRAQAVERLRDEGRLLAHLDHPVVLRALDALTIDGRTALVTEYIKGEDLSGCLGDISRPALLDVLAQVADALHAAWSADGPRGPLRLVHRDIKPSNIRLGVHGEVRLLDFGIARTDTVTREARTASQAILGSLPYMAPERFTADGADPASDVFALGCVLYKGLAAQSWFGDLDVARIAGMAHSEPLYRAWWRKLLLRVPDDVEPAVRELLGELLVWDPRARPTAQQVAERCDALAGEVDGESLRAWARRRAWPPPAALESPLAGHTLTIEGATRPVEDPSPPPRGVALWLGAGAVGVVALVGVAVTVVGLGSLGVRWVVTAGLASVPELEVLEPEVEPVAPVGADVEAASTGAVADSPPADPALRQPVAMPEPEPAEPEVVPGRVVVASADSWSLRSISGEELSSGEAVPPGVWDLWVDWERGGPRQMLQVIVDPGSTVRVECNTITQGCERR